MMDDDDDDDDDVDDDDDDDGGHDDGGHDDDDDDAWAWARNRSCSRDNKTIPKQRKMEKAYAERNSETPFETQREGTGLFHMGRLGMALVVKPWWSGGMV